VPIAPKAAGCGSEKAIAPGNSLGSFSFFGSAQNVMLTSGKFQSGMAARSAAIPD